MIRWELKAVKDFLFADQSANSAHALVGGRVYMPAAPDDATFPYIVWVPQGAARESEYMGGNGSFAGAIVAYALRFVVWSESKYDPAEAIRILDRVKARLDWARITNPAGAMFIEMQPENQFGPEPMDDRMMIAQDYTYRVETV